jgi:16S rRNA (cytosine967-C5)-methyltransferase
MLQLFNRGRSLDDIFASEWYQSIKADKRDLSFSRELSYGLCRWYFTLADLLDKRLQKPLRDKDVDIEIILLLGLYQLLVIKTDVHAAVNETVKLAQFQKKGWARGLINGVLRKVIRDELELDSNAVMDSYPEWLVSRVNNDWGDQADQVLVAGNQRAPMTLRVDTSRNTVDDSLKALHKADIAAQGNSLVASAIELETPVDVLLLPGFDQGALSVQDASAQIAAVLLDCKPGMRVLDACAAPGGKSAHLLQMSDGIELDALDQSETRLERVQQNLLRIGKSARLIAGDASETTAWFDGRAYDRILADVPCTASGVVRRHPDIKLLRRESDVKNLVEQQKRILFSLWELLKPGGILLYSTCSIFKDENEHQVSSFIEATRDCSEIPLDQATWGAPVSYGRQILPGRLNMDGFYYALLQKAL